MKKKISLIVIMCLVVASLAACDGGKTEKETTAAPAETTAATETNAEVTSDGYTFSFKGTTIAMKQDAASILEALGEAKNYTEEKSCAFEGLDKTYQYASFAITTYPDGDKDFINSVALMDDTVATSEGISIGDSKDKVEEVYGKDAFNGVNAYILDKGETELTIIITDNAVSSIQYTAVFK